MEEIVKIVYTYGPIPVLITVIIYLITHPEVAEKWGGLFYRIFSNISNNAERHTVSLDIQGRINSFSKDLNKSIPEILPYGVKIEWVTSGITKESFFRENKLIIKLDYHSNQDENVVKAVLEYISRGLLPDAKRHMNEKLTTSIDLISTKKVLEKERRSAIQYYYREVMDPITTSDNIIKNYVSILNNLDQMGYFTTIVLRELQILGTERKFLMPENNVKEETGNFIDFLNTKVVNKPHGVNVDPNFVGKYIAISIVYVAKGEDIEGAYRWIMHCIHLKIKRIYICAWGLLNIHLVNQLRERLTPNNIFVEGFYHFGPTVYSGKKHNDSICVMYDINRENIPNQPRKAVGRTPEQ